MICSSHEVAIPPRDFRTVKTGISLELPRGTLGLLVAGPALPACVNIRVQAIEGGPRPITEGEEICVSVFNHSDRVSTREGKGVYKTSLKRTGSGNKRERRGAGPPITEGEDICVSVFNHSDRVSGSLHSHAIYDCM
jgi:hypothetical protein